MYLNTETKRLILRPIKLKDAEFILELVNSDGWLNFIGDRDITSISDAEKYIQKILANNNFYYSVFELKESKEAIGIVTFLKREDERYPDIGFALLPAFEKNGYAFEATREYLKIVISSNGFNKIIAMTTPSNHKSINLLEKLGLHFDGDYKKDDEVLSYYSLINIKAASS